MTADSRIERDLTALLEELYLGPSPNYRAEALVTATSHRQRPAWTFAGRWLPMADIASTAPATAAIRWRTVGVTLLIIALLVAALALVAGQQHQKLPAPFGPAANGLIAYPTNGDIYAVDALTGVTTALVSGDSGDLDPLFSPDGTRLAFDRLSQGQNDVTTSIMVADATGAHPFAITQSPLAADGERFEWAPDSRSLYVQTGDRKIWRYDATKAATPVLIASDADLMRSSSRPPDGRQLLIRRSDGVNDTLIVLDVASGDEHPVAQAGSGQLRAARWSNDGQRIAYSAPVPGDDPASLREWIVNGDGSNAHPVTREAGVWADLEMTWSPDDRTIAFLRYQRMTAASDSWDVQPIGLLDVAGGTVKGIGPLPRQIRKQVPSDHDQYASAGEAWAFDWAPDGRSLLAVPSEASGHPVLIDPVAGTWKVIDAIFDEQGGASQEWQRTAP